VRLGFRGCDQLGGDATPAVALRHDQVDDPAGATIGVQARHDMRGDEAGDLASDDRQLDTRVGVGCEGCQELAGKLGRAG
jgi:hypothetical protein